jgi:pimeloyl-[acyl-carrier protein] methyl ester esterase
MVKRRAPQLIPVPGSRVACHEHGSGLPLVFVHGGTGTAAHDWAPVVERLQGRYRSVLVDLRGHGRSAGAVEEVGITRFGLDLTHVLRALGIGRAVLVGFSAGGNTVLHLLARDPRWALAIVTVGASARGDAGRVAEIMAGPWPAALRDLPHAAGGGRDYWRELRAALARDWAANLALDDAGLAGITCPALVCHGREDLFQPLEYAEHLAAGLPRGELALLDGAGHAAHLARPDEFAALLERFLSRLEC